MVKKALYAFIVTLLVSLALFGTAGSTLLKWSAAAPVQLLSVQQAATLVDDGKQALYAHNVLLAKQKFQEAVTANSSDQEAQFFLAITRIAAIYEDGQSLNTSELDSVKEILAQCGATFDSFGLFNTQVTAPQQLPNTAPTTGAVFDFVSRKVLPEINLALEGLTLVSSSGFSSVLQPPALARIGNNYTIDYADVLTIKTFVFAAKATLEVLLAYNWDVNVPNILSADPKDMQDFITLLNNHPDFAKPKEPARLAAAKSALIGFIDTFNLANNQMCLRHEQAGHLFVLDAGITNELAAVTTAEINRFTTALSDIKASLSGPTIYSFFSADNNNRTVDLSRFFDSSNPVSIREKFIDSSSNTFIPDRTFGNILPFGVTSPSLDAVTDAAQWELNWKQVLQRKDLKSIASNGSTSVAVGYEYSVDGLGALQINGHVSTSTDGINWTSQNLIPGIAFMKVKCLENVFIAMGYSYSQQNGSYCSYGPVFLKSTDGVVWTYLSNSANFYSYDIARSNNAYLKVGQGFAFNEVTGKNENYIAESSPDGEIWTPRGFGDNVSLNAVIWADNQFVAIGGKSECISQDGGSSYYCSQLPVVVTSPDGIDWTSTNLSNVIIPVESSGIVFTQFTGIAWSGSRLVVTGVAISSGKFEGFVITSTNGTSWARQILPPNGVLREFPNVVWGGGQFMVVSDDHIWTSADGTTWTEHQFLTIGGLTNAAYGSNRVMAVSRKGIYVSNVQVNPATFTISSAKGPNGSITPAGATAVTSSNNLTYTITPDAGFQVTNLVVDGTLLPGAASYTFANVTGDHYINAYFGAIPVASTIIAAAAPNGSISPAGASLVTSGANRSYSITPDAGFQVANLVVDGTLLPGATSYTFTNVTNDHYINAYFAPVTPFTISAAAAANGSISPSDATPVPPGSSQIYYLSPNPGFAVMALVVDGTLLPGATSYTFTNVSTDHYINAYFGLTVTAAAAANGSISPAGATVVPEASSQTYTITPNPGFVVSNLVVDGTLLPGATSYTFNNVTTEHYINAYFEASAPFTITSAAGANGSISPAGATAVTPGSNQTYTITPDPGFTVFALIVDGTQLPGATSYTFSNVTSNHYINAYFQ